MIFTNFEEYKKMGPDPEGDYLPNPFLQKRGEKILLCFIRKTPHENFGATYVEGTAVIGMKAIEVQDNPDWRIIHEIKCQMATLKKYFLNKVCIEQPTLSFEEMLKVADHRTRQTVFSTLAEKGKSNVDVLAKLNFEGLDFPYDENSPEKISLINMTFASGKT